MDTLEKTAQTATAAGDDPFYGVIAKREAFVSRYLEDRLLAEELVSRGVPPKKWPEGLFRKFSDLYMSRRNDITEQQRGAYAARDREYHDRILAERDSIARSVAIHEGRAEPDAGHPGQSGAAPAPPPVDMAQWASATPESVWRGGLPGRVRPQPDGQVPAEAQDGTQTMPTTEGQPKILDGWPDGYFGRISSPFLGRIGRFGKYVMDQGLGDSIYGSVLDAQRDISSRMDGDDAMTALRAYLSFGGRNPPGVDIPEALKGDLPLLAAALNEAGDVGKYDRMASVIKDEYLGDRPGMSAFLDLARSVGSDPEKMRALSSLVDNPRLSRTISSIGSMPDVAYNALRDGAKEYLKTRAGAELLLNDPYVLDLADAMAITRGWPDSQAGVMLDSRRAAGITRDGKPNPYVIPMAVGDTPGVAAPSAATQPPQVPASPGPQSTDGVSAAPAKAAPEPPKPEKAAAFHLFGKGKGGSEKGSSKPDGGKPGAPDDVMTLGSVANITQAWSKPFDEMVNAVLPGRNGTISVSNDDGTLLLKKKVKLPEGVLDAIGKTVGNVDSVRSGKSSRGRSEKPEWGDGDFDAKEFADRLGKAMMRRSVSRRESAGVGAGLGLASQLPGLAGAGIGAAVGLGLGAMGSKERRMRRMLLGLLLGGVAGGAGLPAGLGAYAGYKSRKNVEKAIRNAGAVISGVSPVLGGELGGKVSQRLGKVLSGRRGRVVGSVLSGIAGIGGGVHDMSPRWKDVEYIGKRV